MKIILVDAIYCLLDKEGNIFKEMHDLLETFPNKKIILTGANDEQIKMFKLNQAPYPFFTLKHDPEKSSPEYYKKMLDQYRLHPSDAIYFEHDSEAVASASSIGITTYHYDNDKKDLEGLKRFLETNV